MALFYATGANAQATRTWVSGVGDDVNPCSRTAPCKTFAGAISKTAAGGEINCLDPGGFGAVSINKSLTIDCRYTEGGVLAGGNGITINDSLSGTPNTAVVFLRGLDIFGVNPPTHGVRFVTGAALHIEDSTIRRFNASSSFGVSFVPSTTGAELYIRNTTIAENGSGATGGGIEIRPTGTGTARALIMDTRVHNNANNGIRIDTQGSTNVAGINAAIENSSFSGNTNGVSVVTNTIDATVAIDESVIANNSAAGIITSGLGTTVIVGGTTITGNATGLSVGGGTVVRSFGTNHLAGNPNFAAPNDGAFTSPIAPQ